jgi:flavin reductase (DIM6/NTAB) family NADH-FMN oxidoreductase RutF
MQFIKNLYIFGSEADFTIKNETSMTRLHEIKDEIHHAKSCPTVKNQFTSRMKYKAFHKLSYGLYLIATRMGDGRYGYIGNTVFQVTSEPSQIAISCSKKNKTTEKILESPESFQFRF